MCFWHSVRGWLCFIAALLCSFLRDQIQKTYLFLKLKQILIRYNKMYFIHYLNPDIFLVSKPFPEIQQIFCTLFILLFYSIYWGKITVLSPWICKAPWDICFRINCLYCLRLWYQVLLITLLRCLTIKRFNDDLCSLSRHNLKWEYDILNNSFHYFGSNRSRQQSISINNERICPVTNDSLGWENITTIQIWNIVFMWTYDSYCLSYK